MSNPWQQLVADFQRMIGSAPPSIVTRLRKDGQAALRYRLIAEEAHETLDAISKDDMVGIVDGLCDLIYVCLGTACEMGIDLDAAFKEVHRSNLEKLGGGFDANGKWQKPPGWRAPDLGAVLLAQGWKEAA